MELDLAYAITIHKSQGSKFETVIISLLYISITKAKKLVMFVAAEVL